MDISTLVNKQRQYFLSGITRPYEFRKDALIRLKAAIKANENQINKALLDDLNKPESESYMCEIGIIYDEIRYHLKHLHKWMKNKKVHTPVSQFWSKSFVSPEPYGVALIMSPWNYPVQLCLLPLIGAISAGNCAVVKPSAYAPNVSNVLVKIISEIFPKEYVSVVEGGRNENVALLEQKFDIIFFTGSVAVGKTVMASAAKHLTPVILELGGKSPVIVDESADIEVAARRIAFGKILNAGQTCVAPDYVFVQKKIKDKFVQCFCKAVREFFPNGDMSDLPHIINDKHFARIKRLMENEKVLMGGRMDESIRLIEPTILDNVTFDSAIMQEEIFGPILPLIEYESIDTCISYIQNNPKPLALYLFTKNREIEKRVLNSCSFGGGCINDTIIHLATPHMGFGGVGESGMGAYHGKLSFEAFSHLRSIVKKHFVPDLAMRYRPYKKSNDKLIRSFLK
ncbi:MAG: aldehyde dehydrogenase [Lachnospiraceae bacterium]|nr:aldehyde dehydrogenase [Lachnospiraceae bacterium]